MGQTTCSGIWHEHPLFNSHLFYFSNPYQQIYFPFHNNIYSLLRWYYVDTRTDLICSHFTIIIIVSCHWYSWSTRVLCLGLQMAGAHQDCSGIRAHVPSPGMAKNTNKQCFCETFFSLIFNLWTKEWNRLSTNHNESWTLQTKVNSLTGSEFIKCYMDLMDINKLHQLLEVMINIIK